MVDIPAWKLLGFKKDPFGQLQSVDDYWESPAEATITAALADACESHSIHGIIADSGFGKSTVLRKAMYDLRRNPRRAVLSIFPEDSRQLTLSRIRTAIVDFAHDTAGLDVTTNRTSPERVRTILKRLAAIEFPEGFAIAVDNCHDVSTSVIRGLRQLIEADSGFEQHNCGLVLVGWNRLDEKLRSLEDVMMRTTFHYLRILTPEEVKSYVAHRIAAAGGKPGIVSDAALEMLAYGNSSGQGVQRRSFNGILNILRRAGEYAASIGDQTIDFHHLQHADPDLCPLAAMHSRAGKPVYRKIIQATRELGGGDISDATVSRGLRDESGVSAAHRYWIGRALQHITEQNRLQPSGTQARKQKSPTVGTEAPNAAPGDRKVGDLTDAANAA